MIGVPYRIRTGVAAVRERLIPILRSGTEANGVCYTSKLGNSTPPHSVLVRLHPCRIFAVRSSAGSQPMPRTVRNPKIDTRTARLRLPQRREPYWTVISEGCALGYRRGARGGTWIAKYRGENRQRLSRRSVLRTTFST